MDFGLKVGFFDHFRTLLCKSKGELFTKGVVQHNYAKKGSNFVLLGGPFVGQLDIEATKGTFEPHDYGCSGKVVGKGDFSHFGVFALGFPRKQAHYRGGPSKKGSKGPKIGPKRAGSGGVWAE